MREWLGKKLGIKTQSEMWMKTGKELSKSFEKGLKKDKPTTHRRG